MAKNEKAKLKGAPKLNVTSLGAPSRKETSGSQIFTAKWGYKKNTFGDKNEYRFEGVMVEWTIDYDVSSSSADKKKKIERIGGTRRSFKAVQVLAGEKKEASYTLARKNYYPCISGRKKTYVKLYAVLASKGKGKKTKKTERTSKGWHLVYTEISAMELALVNKKFKNHEIFSKAQLVKLPKNVSPVGKVFFKSRSASKELIKETVKNPYLYGVGVRVQGWNSKTPTKKVTYKKGKKASTPSAATKKNVRWNEAAPTQAAYFSFAKPQNPKIAAPTIAGTEASSVITFAVSDHDDNKNKGDTGTNANERYDTKVALQFAKGLYNSSGTFVSHGFKDIPGKPPIYPTTKETTLTRLPTSDYGDTISNLELDEYLEYRITAKNRGVRGDSAEVPATFLIACPHNVSISAIESSGPYYEIRFKRTAGKRGKRKTTAYTLQRLYNYRPEPDPTISQAPVDDWSDADWDKAAAKEQDQSWTEVAVLGEVDDSKWDTQTFIDRKTNADPQPFRRTYYRVVATNNIAGMKRVESAPVVLPGYLKIPSAKDEKVDILSCSSAENGNAIQAVVVFNKSPYDQINAEQGANLPAGVDVYEFNEATGEYTKTSDKTAQANKTYYTLGFVKSNGTEMSWDTFEHAWQSSQLPSAYDFKDEQMEDTILAVTAERKELSPVLRPAELGWNFTTYYIRGVQPDTKYYVKARRFLKDTETRETDSYGGYSDYTGDGDTIQPVVVKAKPYEVKLYAPERLVEGRDFSVSWVYGIDQPQKGYQLLSYQNKPSEENKNAAGEAKTLFETGTKEDSAPYAVVPWANIRDGDGLLGTVGAEEHLFTAVRVLTEDGGWSQESEIQDTLIVRAPKASLSPIPDVDRQGFGVTVGTNDNACSIVIRLVAHQLMGWGPQGADNVAEGAIIYSTKVVSPRWVLSEEPLSDGTRWYYSNFNFPTDLDLRDGGRYTIEYTAVNDQYDLDSDIVDDEGNVVKQSVDFTVKFNDQVTVPPFYVVVDPIDEEHSGYARISIMDTPDENEGCVADLYRVTLDGAYLVYEGFSDWRNATLVDRVPPYSRHEACVYRLAMRSPNGVVEWEDRSYAMPGYSVRFDWGDPQSEEQGQYSHLTLPYNLKWSDSWTKNSRVELHLDGTYNGYWRGGVDHKNSLSTELVKMTGAEQVARVRALAQYAGPVMVRLPNGCAFAADVQVSNLDTGYDSLTIAASFSAQEIRLPRRFGQDVVSPEAGLYVPRT